MKFLIQICLIVSFYHENSVANQSQKLNLTELFSPLLTPVDLAEQLQKGWDQGGDAKKKAYSVFFKAHKADLEKIEAALSGELDLARNANDVVKKGLELWSLCLLIELEDQKKPQRYQHLLYLPLRISLEMTFSESTADQMRWGYKFRDRFLILVSQQLAQRQAVLLGSQALQSFNTLRWVWPVDRVLLDESKILVPKKAWPLSQKIISEIQKNPYQSIQRVMQLKKWDSKSILDWSLIWTDQDVKNLRSELTAVSKLQLGWAVLRFKSLENKQPDSQQTLIKAGYLSAQVIDFFSGLPLPLPQL